MHLVWLAVVLLLVPGIAAGQTGVSPERRLPFDRDRPSRLTPDLPPGVTIEAPPGAVPSEIGPDPQLRPHTPPNPTIRSGPTITLPAPLPEGQRPKGWFEFRPTLGISEDYSDNFRRSASNRESNLRSAVNPGMQVMLDRGYLTGSALSKM